MEPWFSLEVAPFLSLFSLFSLLSLTFKWAQKGQHRDLVMNAHKGTVALGVLLLLSGVGALIVGQPYWVWGALMLAGGLLAGLMLWNARQIEKVYSEAELRKTIANDL